jgi:hypothetical protein
MQSAVPDKCMKLPAKESEIHDQEVAGLIHEEIGKLYSDTGVASDEATL